MAERQAITPGRGAARLRGAKARRRLFINITAAVVVVAAIVGVWLARRPPPRLPEGLATDKAQRFMRNLPQAGPEWDG